MSESGPTKKIRITSTVPIICNDNSSDCSVVADIYQNNGQALVNGCSLNFKGKTKAGVTRELEVIAKRDFEDENAPYQVMFIKIMVHRFFFDIDDWIDYRGVILVKVRYSSRPKILITTINVWRFKILVISVKN